MVPLIPAILIYKIFPKTAVSTSGSLANFKINSSGAFAAYLATVLIGIYALSDTQTRILNIKNPFAPTWTINGHLELRDLENEIVDNPNLFKQVFVSIEPKIFPCAYGDIHYKIPGTIEGIVPQRMITIEVVGFGKGQINLTTLDLKDSEKVSIDYEKKCIVFNKPITIRALNDPVYEKYKESDYMTPQPEVKNEAN